MLKKPKRMFATVNCACTSSILCSISQKENKFTKTYINPVSLIARLSIWRNLLNVGTRSLKEQWLQWQTFVSQNLRDHGCIIFHISFYLSIHGQAEWTSLIDEGVLTVKTLTGHLKRIGAKLDWIVISIFYVLCMNMAFLKVIQSTL